jgi:glycosyltransferase involved in cell wall biosynthesis
VGVNKGAVADLITPGMDGLLAKPNAPRSLAEQIQILLKDPGYTYRLGQEALHTAANYHWRAINKRLLASYANLIARAQQERRSPAMHKASRETLYAEQNFAS